MHDLESGQMVWKQKHFKEEGDGYLAKQETEVTEDWIQLSPSIDFDSNYSAPLCYM